MIRVHRKLDSETLYLPEIKSMIGKTVEITIQEETAPELQLASDWDAAMQAVRELEDFDGTAYQRQREYDLQHAMDHLP